MTSIPRQLSSDEAKAVTERIRYEDGLLMQRTGCVLTLNGLAAVAVAMDFPAEGRLLAIGCMAVVNSIWILCAREAVTLIREFRAVLLAPQNAGVAPLDEQARVRIVHRKGRISVNRYFGIIIPGVLLTGWIVGLLRCAWLLAGSD